MSFKTCAKTLTHMVSLVHEFSSGFRDRAVTSGRMYDKALGSPGNEQQASKDTVRVLPCVPPAHIRFSRSSLYPLAGISFVMHTWLPSNSTRLFKQMWPCCRIGCDFGHILTQCTLLYDEELVEAKLS